MATLLARSFAARSVHDIADAVLGHMREAMDAQGREPTWMGNLRRGLAQAARDVCLAELPRVEDSDAVIDAPGTEQRLLDCITQAAQQIDGQRNGSLDGSCLRSCGPALVAAARGVARRSSGREELQAARELEESGAPPALLFRLDGDLIWFNGALATLCERLDVDRATVRKDAKLLVRNLALASRALGGSADAGKGASVLGARTELFLRALLRPGRGDLGTMLIEVIVSQARRETRLTPRELQVACMLAEHGSYRPIAKSTGLSLDSVRTYVRRVYRKLAVNNRNLLKARLIHDGLFSESRRQAAPGK